MSLTRQTQKVFASNANANQLAVFGSMKTGTPVYSTSLSTLQSTAYTEGWSEALLNDKAPYMEEMNAVQYGLSYQIAYLLQEGIPTYDSNTNYSDTSIVKSIESGKLYFYRSLSDNNSGHALTNTTYWEKISISDTRNIGEIVQSTIPLTDAGLHLLDGSLLSGSGSYSSFVTYIAGLYTATPTANYFCTEAQWQDSVTNYGVCGKFVYDSVNNTVRLPKITGFIEGTSGVATLGNLTEAGLPNITGSLTATFGGLNASSGAFTDRTGSQSCASGGSAFPTTVAFDASASSSIYGNSSTVQPQSVKVLYYIVVVTSTKTQLEVDIDEIATDLNGKLDKDGSNAATGLFESAVSIAQSTGKSTVVGWGMPDYSNGTSKTASTVYQASSNICLWVRTNTNGVSGDILVGSTSDTVNTSIFGFGGNVASHNSMHVYIPKGTYYNCSGNGFEGIVEYPLIGG